MQKWIGIGKIDEEPVNVKLNGYDALLMWVRCTRSWDATKNDAVPVLWLGKRRYRLLKHISTKGAVTGALVYVTGEISSRVKIEGEKEMTIGSAVFGNSISFWDSEAIATMENKVASEEEFIGSSLEDYEEQH